MRREAVPVLAWATLLSVLATVLWSWTDDPLPPALFTGAAAATWLLGIGVATLPPRRPDVPGLRDFSVAVLVVAVGAVFLVNALLLGRWLALIGGGVLLLGLAVLARELRLARRAR